MNWVRENPFLTLVLLITLAGGGALGVMISGTASEYREISEIYDSQERELQRLTALDPYPDQENLDRLKVKIEAYLAEIRALELDLAESQVELEEIEPTAFQDHLRGVVSEITELAREENVALPPNFYMGFNQYQAQLPPAAVTPLLAYQLDVIQELMEIIIANRIERLTVLERTPLPGEPEGGARSEDAPYHLYPLRIALRSDQHHLRSFLNDLMGMDAFLVLRRINVLNERTDGPRRGTTAPAATGAFDATGLDPEFEEEAEEERIMNFVLGQEKVTATLHLEMVRFDFTDEEEETAEEADDAAPDEGRSQRGRRSRR